MRRCKDSLRQPLSILLTGLLVIYCPLPIAPLRIASAEVVDSRDTASTVSTSQVFGELLVRFRVRTTQEEATDFFKGHRCQVLTSLPTARIYQRGGSAEELCRGCQGGVGGAESAADVVCQCLRDQNLCNGRGTGVVL